MQRSAGIAVAQRLWQSFAFSSSSGASTSSIVSSSGGGSGGLAAALSDALIWMGTRDPKTRRGKIFKGSFGKVGSLPLHACPMRCPDSVLSNHAFMDLSSARRRCVVLSLVLLLFSIGCSPSQIPPSNPALFPCSHDHAKRR
jgi:ribosomal small subunit protein bTHX